MKEAAQMLESAADHVLSILKPLLASETPPPIRTVVEQLRVLNPPHDVLAATINTLAKLVSAFPPSSNQQTLPSQRHLRGLVSVLTSSRILPREILYSALDSDAASLLLDAENWRSDHLRTRTRMWYTQTRFNLFREETEGYAKALSQLWKSSFSPAEPSTVFETLISYIGQYSLDTNRVIEIVLTVAAERVLESITKTSGRPIAHRIPQPFAYILEQFPQSHICTVIGAMLRAYHDSAITDTEVGAEAHSTETDSKFEAKASHALVSLVSVMVSEGKLQVADILGYLSPIDNSEFKTRFALYEKDVGVLAESVNGSRMGAHRASDDLKGSRSFHGATDRDVFLRYKLMEKGPLDSFYIHSQKINFILTLIGLCRSRDAVTAIFGLSVNGEHIDVAACPTITKAFIGIIEALLSPLLSAKFPSLYTENKILTNAIRQLGGKEKGYDVPVETIEEFLSDDEDGPGIVIRQLLLILGPYARTSTRLLQALCRIFKGQKEKHIVSIMKEVVLPASSLIQSNVALADDVWNVLKHWHHPTRWDLYGYVLRVVSATNAEYQVVSGRASYETRYVLKRLTADNQKQHTLTIAKITHGQAIASFSAALDRIQGYPADAVTISPVIEACRRCTYLSIDILLYLVLNRMADSRRSRLKEDGINIAQWYATLSLFMGLCLRKLSIEPEHIDAVLYFMHSKLVEDDEPLMIAALSDIIKCVADIEVDINLSLKQIRSYAGGFVLREVVSGPWSKVQPDAQLCGTASDSRAEKERNSATCMLLEAFERTAVYSYLAVAIARLTRDAVRHESIRTMPLKLGGNIVDMARTSMLQLSQFMDTRPCDSRRNKECRQRISRILCNVGLGEMVQAMRVPVSSAVALVAPELDCVVGLEAEFENDAKREVQRIEPSHDAKHSPETISMNHAETVDDARESNTQKLGGDSNTANRGSVLKDLQTGTRLSEFLHRRTRGSIPKSLLAFFWYANLNDISSAEDMYETEQKRFTSIKGVWEKEVEASRLRGQLDNDRLRRLNYESSRIQEYMEKLGAERKSLASRLAHVIATLKKRTEEMTSGAKTVSSSEGRQATYFFLQECVLPRCKVSRPDALFCSSFVQLLLEQKIPAICFRGYYEILLQLTPTIIRSCSENESLCFAYLIKETLVTLDGWRSNRSMYLEQAASTNSFQNATQADKAGPMNHWQYCQWLYDIHAGLVNGLSSVLSSREYLHSRNSLSLLNAVAEVFPKVSEHCSKIEDCVERLTKSDLADVRLTSTGVLARLRAGKARRLPTRIFKLRPVGGGEGSPRGNATGTNAPIAPKRTGTQGDTGTGPRATAKSPETDTPENVSDKKEKLSGRVSPQVKQETPSPTQPSGQGQSSSGKPACGGQDKAKQAMSSVGSGSNGIMGASISDGTRTETVRRRLDPSAREFVPVSEKETSTQPGKRSRPSDGDSIDSMRHPVSNMDGSIGQSSKDRPPPLKKARGEGNVKRDDRKGESSTGEKLKDSSLKEPTQAHGPVSTGESNKMTSITPSDDKDTIPGAPGGSQNGGTGRVVRGDRVNSPGRRNTGMRQAFDNGKEYGHNKPGAGDRYRDSTRLRNIRRDNVASNVIHGRDAVRDTVGRDHGPGRRRDAYDHSGGGDRRANLQAGDFRRSASESKLGEGAGGNDFNHSRDYHGDAQGTKRRRELAPPRGPYGYESEGRRQTRSRKEGEYDRFHDDGKNGPDRRFSGNSPGRENGGTNNPNWMGGRRHGDVHESTRRQGDVHESARRQGDEEQLGWQKRAERDFDGGPRGMRRGDRETYYDRPERFGEGPGRRDDRRRPPPRGRGPRRRMGRG